uniref:phycytochrome bilisome core-membrane linker protein n=1 Tax=Madagascaria erythrocladioides TaxID=753684 RepID=UPI001BEFD96A|nr:phycytochrome bilisome core-membrane linker protein [Madagascaria erythrocladioides]QUE28968.1 ApcE [Madagascaria erythrocladioides]UNJ16519.1 phycytochrome bilisome core-membrane linker protein [Madagascaria erythrocladioides]
MSVQASGGSPLVRPQLYRTNSILAIKQAEQQDRFLQTGELSQLAFFLNSGVQRLEIASILTKNANVLVSRAADKIFVGGSAISYLERPQAAISDIDSMSKQNEISGDAQTDVLEGFGSLFSAGEATPPGFKPINVAAYGPTRMRKSVRDLDWFLRYLTYAIVAGDTNILSVNIRGLRELIENACSSAAAIVALREMRRTALTIFPDNSEEQNLVREYFNTLISEFEAPSFTDKLRKRSSKDLQGLKLPQIYSKAGVNIPKYAMKSVLSDGEKSNVIKAAYRQVFERDIAKAYGLIFSDLESKVKNGQISMKEFIREIGKSKVYQKQFYEPFVNSRVVELAFRHFLGRGLSSLEEFQKYFGILSTQGLSGLVDSLVNSVEYSDYFGEETVPYFRDLGEEPQECRNWGAQINLLNYSAPFRKVPQFITLFSDYGQQLPDQHPYGRGNDPLSIQFGAIFPKDTKNPKQRPVLFGKDTRRILVRKGPGIFNQMSSPSSRSKNLGTLGPKIFKLNDKNTTIESIINAAYLKVFGRLIYQEERENFKKLESQLKEKSISLKTFIAELAKSQTFRKLYWEPFYICKAIEYIHTRLLGRPTYGRQEINKYFDVIYKKDYFAFIDSIIDSQEYMECFGETIIPYERYITPSGLALRTFRPSTVGLIPIKVEKTKTDRFIELGAIKEVRSANNIIARSKQGVTTLRSQRIVFELKSDASIQEKEQIIKAAYRQIFERDINVFSLGNEFVNIETSLLNGEISAKEFVEQLGSSSLYSKEFYQPYPNTKVIELGTKHFLGRAPNNQAEIRFYNQILASKGLAAFIQTLTNSKEYEVLFGSNTIPYRRFPTLPASNFPNTEKLYNNFTKQDMSIVVPSFKAIKGNQ